MAEEIIEITVSPDGKIEMQVSGIAGTDCIGETDELVQLLGGTVESQELTAEAYLDTEERQQDRQWH